MSDTETKLSLMERRLTALEREVHELRQVGVAVAADSPMPDRLLISCDAPGLLASHAYPKENLGNGLTACWLGSPNFVQLTLPVAPVKPFLCKLTISPFHKVALDTMKIQVNDAIVEHSLNSISRDMQNISFYGNQSRLSFINIVFLDLKSLRPKDLGESEDVRLLAFRFFGAEIEFISASQAGGA